MIDIYVEEVHAQIRRIPAEECRIDGEPDENIIEIDMDDFTISMTEEVAEDLYNSLAIYFAELP